MILELIDEAAASGATQKACCERLDLDPRTITRWRQRPGGDLRAGPHTEPKNKLSAAERRRLLEVANSAAYRDLPPSQIVPRLADQGVYIASESTMYRTFAEAKQLAHRGRDKEPKARQRPPERVATRPNQVWSWDISYLKAPARGEYFYLYVVMDVWSRKIVAAAVHENESQELAAALVDEAVRRENISRKGLYLHSDNGGAMTGMTMLAKLQSLGVVASFSRPATSNDNPFSEALFRTLKYRPSYPDGRFASLVEARAWVARFVDWYNGTHLHSGITFTSPSERHDERDAATLAKRRRVYAAAKARHPERWGSREHRAWKRVERVHLNPSSETLLRLEEKTAA